MFCIIYSIKLSDAVTLGGAYNGAELLQQVYKVTWFVAVGRRLIEAPAAVTLAIRATLCAQLSSASSTVCASRNRWRK